jgi:hypothetical protein
MRRPAASIFALLTVHGTVCRRRRAIYDLAAFNKTQPPSAAEFPILKRGGARIVRHGEQANRK